MESIKSATSSTPPRKRWVQWLIWIFNVIGYKLGWFACAYGAVFGYYYEGAIVMGVLVVIHFWTQGWPKAEIQFTLLAVVIGTLMDTSYNVLNVVDYGGTYPGLEFLAPLWITAIWAGFSATLDYSLGFLAKKPWLTAGLAAFFGPFSYWGGAQMGAISFENGVWPAMVVIGIEWAIMLPLLYVLLNKLKARHQPALPLA